MSFSGYVGGHKTESVRSRRARHPELLVERAVRGMIPHNRLGRNVYRKLKVYRGDSIRTPRNSPKLSNLEVVSMPQTEEFIATGRRKTSVARVRMMPGSGKIDINGRTFEDYFPTVPLQNVVLQPLQNAKAVNTYDVFIHANGGGIMGQAGAAQLAIARALLQVDANFRGPLKAEGLLRRDPRMKERKKSGQPGARKRFQFSKR
jgi:Ribosomal protein S9